MGKNGAVFVIHSVTRFSLKVWNRLNQLIFQIKSKEEKGGGGHKKDVSWKIEICITSAKYIQKGATLITRKQNSYQKQDRGKDLVTSLL